MRTKLDILSIAAILLTVLAVSMTAPLTAYATAPALALAFARNALGLLTLGPVFLLVRRREMRKVFRRERLLVRKEQRRAVWFGVCAGTALAAHFVMFMTSTQMTSVAMATALVATQPVWQALIATVFQHTRLPRITWAGLSVSVVGAVVASGADLRAQGTEAIIGDLLAIAGAIAQAVYAAFSERARPDVSTSLYSVLCFSVCTVELLVVCLITGTPAFTFSGNDLLALLGLLLLPQLLGLLCLNFALGRAPATAVSVLLLLEAPVAALIAWMWLDQLPVGMAWLGLSMIMLGVTVIVVADARRAESTDSLDETAPSGGLLSHPYPTFGSVPVSDPHAVIWRVARAGRLAEAEALIRGWEARAVQQHGAKSPEATHWIEVRAVVARIAGNHGLAAQLWLSSAAFHLSAPSRDTRVARACVDQAFHEWHTSEDEDAIRSLAPALRAMYAGDPDHRPHVLDVIDRRLTDLGVRERT